MDNAQTLVIVVHGNQTLAGNTLDPEYADRCKQAVEIIQQSTAENTYIVLTGGETVSGRIAESAVALPFLTQLLNETNTHADIFLEMKSRTTGENISGAQNILKKEGITPDRIVFIGRKSQLRKIRTIAMRIWILGEPKVEFVAGIDNTPLWYQKLDWHIMPIISFLDPRDKYLLAPFKVLFRNG